MKMVDNQKIKDVYEIIVKFLNIENNNYDIKSFKFRDILSRYGYDIEYNLFPLVYRNIKLFKSFAEDEITMDELKELLKKDSDYYFYNLDKVTITFDRLYEICFTKPKELDLLVKELLDKYDKYDLRISHII